MTDQAVPKVGVYLVDDDPQVRRAVGRLLAAWGIGVECFDSAESLLATLPKGSAGCALLDVRLPEMDGPQLQELLSLHSPAITVVFLTGHGDLGTAVRVMKHGALDYLIKPVSEEALIPMVRAALRLSNETSTGLVAESSAREAMLCLSAREREVMEHVVSGRLNKQIAADLGIAEKTVKVHRGRVMAKMKVRSVPELVRKFEALGVGRPRSPRR